MSDILRMTSSAAVNEKKPSKIKFSLWHTFKHHIPRFLLTIFIDVILPFVIYIYLQKRVRPVYALLAASSPPLLMVIIKGILLWTFDALGFFVFLTFTITAIAAVISRNPLIIVLEKSLMTGILSFVFGVTLIPIHCCKHWCRWRPLAYYFYQDFVPTRFIDIGLPENMFNGENDQIDFNYAQLKEEAMVKKSSHKNEVAQVYEWLHKNCTPFRVSCYFITSVWAVGYFLEFLTRAILILAGCSINTIVIYGHIILSLITAVMIILTVICITIERKYTLAFIENWQRKYLKSEQRRASDILSSTSIVTANPNSNSILCLNT